MGTCKLYDYADDNSLPVASWHIHGVLSYLSRDCKDGSETMEYKLIRPFMIISHSPVDISNAMLQIGGNIALKHESQAKMFGVTV